MFDALLHRKISSFIAKYSVASLADLVVPVLEDERDTGHSDSNENHDEDAANILNRDTVRLVLCLFTLGRHVVLLPPFFLEFFEIALIKELQDSELSGILVIYFVYLQFN